MIKIVKAVFTSLFFNPSFQIRNNDSPIIKYKIIQTGPKILSGGLNSGLLIVVYHPDTDLLVNNAPIIPGSWHITMLNISFRKFDNLYLKKIIKF